MSHDAKAVKHRKSVSRIVVGHQAMEGAGFLIHRPFPTHELLQIDPFLLLDEMGPISYAPGAAQGAPDHPHRGFETVTYLLAGEMEHRDSAGHVGTLRPGDLQWMTAGAGVVHSEMPSAAFQKTGGLMHGFQLWVNLAAKDKRASPRYQELSAAHVRIVEDSDLGERVKVLAGEYRGVTAQVQTHQPILYLDVELKADAEFILEVQKDLTNFVYIYEGSLVAGSEGKHVAAHQLALFDDVQGELFVKAKAQSRFLVLAAAPLREPVARRGPFVMNTEQEIREAILDYQSGRFAEIPPKVDKD
ncbi:MAG: pirin family protein [Proteobacteria bacterium]|nr:pirin family protein [Pseudomonadota bacterium]